MSSATTRKESEEFDAYAIPANLMRWEYLLIIISLSFASYLVWYVTQNLLIWDPNSSMWGLPKPIVGAIIISLTWITANFILFAIYYTVITKRIKALRASRRGEVL